MKRRQWSIVEEIVSSNAENPESVDTAPPVCTKTEHRFLVIVVMVLVMALTTLGACSPADSTPYPEHALALHGAFYGGTL